MSGVTPCPHLNFGCFTDVNRITGDGTEAIGGLLPVCEDIVVAVPGSGVRIPRDTADIRIGCRDCGQPFEFFGLPFGLSFYRPTVSINHQQLRVPLVLPGTEPPPGLAGFAVTHKVFEKKEAVKQ